VTNNSPFGDDSFQTKQSLAVVGKTKT